MAETLAPTTLDQTVEAVRWATAEEVPLALVCGGSKSTLGRPVNAAHTLRLAGLTGIRLYEPEELVMAAGPGTPLAEVEAALVAKGQMLAFEPPDLGPLLGGPAQRGSIGGAFATALSGPRRIRAGAARDHVLGVEAVSGRGEEFKSGGRVMKNVTGYDLPKLLTGSYGTLAALTQLTFKVLPRPEAEDTVLVDGLDDAAAVAALTAALHCPYEVTGAAHLPAAIAAVSAVDAVRRDKAAVTAVRVDGFGPSVRFRADWLARELGRFGPTRLLGDGASQGLWREICDVAPFVGDDRIVWRLSVAPNDGPIVAAHLAQAVQAAYFLDWGGGLVWLALESCDDAGVAAVREALAGRFGHATLIRAPESARASITVFQPQVPALAALTARVKEGFDPKRILNPGRMYAGV